MAQDNGSLPAARMLEELGGTMLDGRYALGRVLGTGGMGAVFEAEDQRLSRPVAIKLMRPVFAGHDEYIKRFLREAQSASKVRHRNVVVVLDYGTAEGGLVYSVMEFLVGEDLEQRLRKAPQKRITWPEACGLLAQIASGLRAAHAKGVVHRDIKPANCFITEEDEESVVKLVDFGIAKLDNSGQTQQLTGTAQVLGTPSYIAPELVQTTAPASPQSDVYSLGVVAYRMLTGVLPFTADTPFEVIRRACMNPVPRLRDRVPELPEGVEALVMEMLAKTPTDRPADMGAVRHRLRTLSHQTLGPQAVQFPESNALSVGVDPSGPPPDPTYVSTAPREGPRRVTEQPLPRAVGITAVIHNAGPEKNRRRPARPPNAPPAVIVALPARAKPPMFDRASASSRSGETLPALGESTLRMGNSRAMNQPARRGEGWLVFGIVAGTLVLAGAAGSIAFQQDDGSGSDERAAVAKTNALVSEDVEPLPTSNEVERGPMAATLPTEESVEREDPPPEPEPQPERLAESTPKQESDSETSPEPEPTVDPPVPTTPTLSPPQPKVEDPKKPSGPPSDGRLEKRLRRKIKSKCSSHLAGRRVTVSLIVTQNGGTDFLTATLKDAAGECAKGQVNGTKFRPRDQETPFKIVIEE